MKYVTFNHTVNGREQVTAVLFNDELIHLNVSSGVIRAARGFMGTGIPVPGGNATPRSAGFFCLNGDGAVTVFGRSDSMNLGPQHDDADVIAKALKGGV